MSGRARYRRRATWCALVAAGSLIGALGTTAAAQATPKAASASKQLIIAGYGGNTPTYFTEKILVPFEHATGIKVTWLQVPGEQLAGVESQEQAHHVKWDMTIGLDDNSMGTLLKAGYLATMPKSLEAAIKKNIPNVEPYGVPSKQGGVLIACNMVLVKKCPTNATELFNTTAYPGSRMFPSFQPDVMIGLALEAEKIPSADMVPSSKADQLLNLKLAETELTTLQPSIKTFYSSSSTAVQLLESGEVDIAGIWNSALQRLATATSSTFRLSYTWNQAAIYSQWDVVYKNAPDEANAFALLKWINDHPAEVAAYANLDAAGESSPAVQKLMSPSTRQWLPSTARVQKGVLVTPWFLQTSLSSQVTDFWTNYTAG